MIDATTTRQHYGVLCNDSRKYTGIESDIARTEIDLAGVDRFLLLGDGVSFLTLGDGTSKLIIRRRDT